MTYQSDDWVTECGVGPETGVRECTLTVPFQENATDQKGAFALVVMLQSGNVAIVGQPFPERAQLQVDANPPIECRQTRYCLFGNPDSLAVIKEFVRGSVILIDVFTAGTRFRSSLTLRGYRAGLAQIRAWGYSFDGE